tara:strand:+ start:62 stop:517 length:456 start_codon:yes stop_codon:yes gene_type:complete
MLTAINNSKIDISSKKSTKRLAKDLIFYLNSGDIIFLYGEMGVGKTTFIRYLINEFQESKNLDITEVPSPTFNLLNEYQVQDLVIKHYDLFRIKDKSEIKDLHLFEDTKNIITLIEWPELIEKKKIINTIDLTFSYENEFNSRSVKINGLS